MNLSDAPQVKRRPLLWLALGFGVTLFLLGATALFLGNLRVSYSMQVQGHPVVNAGQSALFRVWATGHDTKTHLENVEGARIQLTLFEGAGDVSVAHANATTDTTGSGLVSLPIPEELSPGNYRVEATLSVPNPEGEPFQERASFDIEVRATSHDFRVRPPLASNCDGGSSLKIEAMVLGDLQAFLDGEVFLRVSECEGGAPVHAVLSIEKRYGRLKGTPPTQLETDALGLTTLSLHPLTETDWSLRATTRDGRKGALLLTLPAAPRSLGLRSAEAFRGPGEALSLHLETHSAQEVSLHLLVGDAWVASTTEEVDAKAAVRWRLGEGFEWPSTPTLVTVAACATGEECFEDAARAALFLSNEALPQEQALKQLQGLLMASEVKAASSMLYGPELDFEAAGGAARDRALRFLMAHIEPSRAHAQQLVFSANDTRAGFAASRASFRSTGALLVGVFLAVGGLLLMGIIIKALWRRRRLALELEAHQTKTGFARWVALYPTLLLSFQILVYLCAVAVLIGGILTVLSANLSPMGVLE